MKIRKRHVLLAGMTAPLILAPAAFASGPTSDSTFRVDTTADTVDANPGDGVCADADGHCSLRAAVQESNADRDMNRIVLQRGAQYALSIAGQGEDSAASGDLDVTSKIMLRGRGASVDGAGIDRIFDVKHRASLDARSLGLTGGAPAETESGGAIASAGSLHLRSVKIAGNAVTGAGASGGGVFNDGGTFKAVRTVISNNSAVRAGGGIEANAGVTELERVKLEDNSTGDAPGNGGGLHLTGAGDVSVVRSLVRGNTASAEGGGLWNSAGGTMNVSHTVVIKNVASGDPADQGGGGLFNDGGVMRVKGGHVSGNTADGAAGSGGGVLNNAGRFMATGTSIVGNTSMRAGGGIEVNGESTTNLKRVKLDRNSTGAAPGNGGGLHVTGKGRVSVDRSKVRANTAAAEGGGLWNSAVGSMKVTDSVIARNVASGDPADQGGGGLFNDGGLLRVEGGRVSGNSADGASGSGGGALNDGGRLIATGTSFTGNSSMRAGGGIEANGESVTHLKRVELDRNRTGAAPGNGGGLHVTGKGFVTVDRSKVRANTASAEGGGLWNSGVGFMKVTNSVINRNVASGDDADQGGGGLFNDGGEMRVEDTVANGNVANGEKGSGGGVLNNLGRVVVEDSSLARNRSNRAGGAIEANAGVTYVQRTKLFRNRTGDAPGNGGGIHLTGDGRVLVKDSDVRGNVAANEGGGIWNSAVGTTLVTRTTIRGNRAPIGPDVFNDGGTFRIDGEPVPPGGGGN